MHFDLNTVWKVLAWIISQDMAARYQEQPISAFKEKPTGVRQLLVPAEGQNSGGCKEEWLYHDTWGQHSAP